MKAIDVWSVGVTFLCILTGQFPFFQSNSDDEAIIEITNIFGKKAMQELAYSLSKLHLLMLDRRFDTNIPTRHPSSLRAVVRKMAPHMESIGNEGFQLLDGMLCIDSRNRLTAAQALEMVQGFNW